MNKEVVLLTGASGSMGFETFRLLWEKRDRYDIVLLLRPSKKNRKKFRKYERLAAKGNPQALKIVWGDALNRKNVAEACRGIDWCLHTMALISPKADCNPEMSELVNTWGTRYLVEAIEEEAPEHIRMVSVGSVAEYGDRMLPVHVGRTGDPVIPSKYDHYAITKIKGELSVMQSRIKRRVSLRQTFIMIPRLFSLMDPIMFHQPINTFMENITAKDAGRMMIRCLDIPDDSDFWGGYYNVSGGAGCRTTYLEFLDSIYRLLGIRYWKVMERRWFALKNFHMQFFEDSGRLNDYLQHWEGGQTMEDFFMEVWRSLPRYLKATAWCNRNIPPFRALAEGATRVQLRRLAHRDEGTMHWIRHNNHERINAFYGSREAFNTIHSWNGPLPPLAHHQGYNRLDHGYDETKEELEFQDLQVAARFRGGEVVSDRWDRDMHALLSWSCCRGHSFRMTPHAVLKGGHWCLECIAPPWDYDAVASGNLFAAQVLAPVIKK
jgi:nucleoside-diphosphate-sugar epimerase